MQKQQIILISGIVLALIAVFMTKTYLDQQRRVIQENVTEEAKKELADIQSSQATVFTAKKELPQGYIIQPEDLAVQVVPNQFIQPQAVTTMERAVGMMTVAPISKDEQITLTKLTTLRQRGGLAEATPVGKRAITINVDNLSTLAGMIKPGDYVDVIAMVPVPVQTPDGKQATQVAVLPVFQNVLILAVGQQTGTVIRQQESRYRQEEAGGGASSLITLALTSMEANMLSFVSEQGKLRLVLRSPADSKVEPIQPASWETLFQYVMPNLLGGRGEPAQKQAVEPEPTSYVEVYRGLTKEKVPLSK